MDLIKKSKHGFTLIEVVIVLAIAALILVIVIFAIAGAQRAQRDTKNKDAATKTLAALEQYAGNNGGTYPAIGASVGGTYLNGITSGTTGAAPVAGGANSTASAASPVIYSGNATCGANGAIVGGSGRQAAVSYWSEAGGNAYCINN